MLVKVTVAPEELNRAIKACISSSWEFWKYKAFFVQLAVLPVSGFLFRFVFGCLVRFGLFEGIKSPN
jgi:hypothetical protein